MENLQKPATVYRESYHPHRGILDPQGFAKHFRLCCYLPSADMAPFVAHYFVSRRVKPQDTYTPTDVLTRPAVTLFFVSDQAYVSGVTTGRRTLKNTDIYAGAKFVPGGFHPFWQRSISELAERRQAAMTIFPEANAAFTRHLLARQNDGDIVSAIESLLRTQQPRLDPNIRLINAILATIESDDSLHTVAALVRRSGINERTLQHLFHTYVGSGPKWCIMRARFLRAISHAHSRDETNWTTIAAELGYSTQSHFSNDFKKLIGVSPVQYIKLLQQG